MFSWNDQENLKVTERMEGGMHTVRESSDICKIWSRWLENEADSLSLIGVGSLLIFLHVHYNLS